MWHRCSGAAVIAFAVGEGTGVVAPLGKSAQEMRCLGWD